MGSRLAIGLLAFSLVSAPQLASADDADPPRSYLHGTLGLGHAIGEPQSHELGWGGQVGLAYELRSGKIVGLEVALDALDLTQGSPPVDPRFAQRTQGASFDGMVAARVLPLGWMMSGGPWIEAGAGAAYTGSNVRPLMQARVGWDLLSVHGSDVQIGPFVGYTQVIQSADALRPEDAHILWIGASIDLTNHREPRFTGDRDHDGVADAEDACPDVPGIRTASPASNGCPWTHPDRDKDGVFDDQDACPDVPGIRTTDPATNGCPLIPPDRDHDTIPDKEDACPDVPGIRTSDPKTNGCPPPDRDKDGVLNEDDACPDVPGIHTDDPKTNGCPAASDGVRVEGDQILLNEIIYFDTGSPRVRHVSWPILKKLANYFDANPDIEEVDIEGHADDVGTTDYNLYLSRERAASVKRMLVNYGVPDEKITTHAYGEARPRKPGHDEDARRENRRVEFTITRSNHQGSTPPATTPAPASATTPAAASGTTAATTTTAPPATTPAVTPTPASSTAAPSASPPAPNAPASPAAPEALPAHTPSPTQADHKDGGQ